MNHRVRELQEKLKIASGKHEIISVLLSDPKDFELPSAGILKLTDFETGSPLWIDASDKQSRKLYTAMKEKAYDQTLSTFKKSDIDCIELKTNESVIDALSAYFRYREKRIR